jgi:hypothetical protein
MHGSQSPAFRGEFVKTVTFNIESVGKVPVKLGTIEDVGMSDDAIADLSDRSCHWQGIPRITPNCCPYTSRDN